MEIPFAENQSCCIDISSLIKLDTEFSRQHQTFKALWDEMDSMIMQGTLYSCEFIEEEAERYMGKHTFIKDWICKHKSRFIIPNDSDARIIIAASKVINENLATGFLNRKKWESGINEADPYLIALGMVKGCKIISNESKEKPNRIPQVAFKYGVTCIDVYKFFKERGLEMVKK